MEDTVHESSEEAIHIEMFISAEEFREKAKSDPVSAARYLDGEISAFDAWMQGRGMDMLTRYETQILREYLGFKLVTSAKSVDSDREDH